VAAIRSGAAAGGITEGGGGGGARPSDGMAAGKGEGADIVAGAAGLVAPLTTRVTTGCMERKGLIIFLLIFFNIIVFNWIANCTLELVAIA
jgi:hypothetical protein